MTPCTLSPPVRFGLTVPLSLHRYLSDVAHVDIYWFIGSRLDVAPSELPHLTSPIHGSSTVPWRYHFNTGMPPLIPSVISLGILTGLSHLFVYNCLLDMGGLGVTA